MPNNSKNRTGQEGNELQALYLLPGVTVANQ
jgi:hypothetical protein